MNLHLERQPYGTGPQDRWGRWHALDDAGAVVGLVLEDRDFDGSNLGPSRYIAVHNPDAVPYGSRWRSPGHPTPAAALAVLVAHLDGDEAP
jgi:hypothetical protein